MFAGWLYPLRLGHGLWGWVAALWCARKFSWTDCGAFVSLSIMTLVLSETPW
jgi:hypothetical protein